MKKSLMIGVLLLGMCVVNAIAVGAAEPTITVDPESPTPASEVTFSVETSDDNVLEVWLIVQECKGSDFCYTPQNVSAEQITDTEYEAKVTLQYGDSTYINYYANIKSESGWEQTESVKLYLSTPSNGDDTNSTPGFEGILLLLSLAIVIFLVRGKKRVQ
jgi:hypothetical protein